MNYYSILTNIGEEKHASHIANKTELIITHFAVGDGNGSEPVPDPTQTALVNEVYRMGPDDISEDVDKSQVTIFVRIPTDVGGFVVRELGIFDQDGDLIAVSNFPTTAKPELGNGVNKEMHLSMTIQVSSTGAVTIMVDPSVVMATKEWVRLNFTPSEQTHKFDTSVNGVDMPFTLPNTQVDGFTVNVFYQDILKTASVKVSASTDAKIAGVEEGDTADIDVVSLTKFVFEAEKKIWHIIKGA